MADALGDTNKPIAVPMCPRCGMPARQTNTQYGVRSECCGLWSWDGKPLVDAGTHAARRDAKPLMDQVIKALGMGAGAHEVMRRLGKKHPDSIKISLMNERQARKMIEVLEDIIIDILSGEVEMRKGGKK